jgi:hypothetical protein
VGPSVATAERKFFNSSGIVASCTFKPSQNTSMSPKASWRSRRWRSMAVSPPFLASSSALCQGSCTKSESRRVNRSASRSLLRVSVAGEATVSRPWYSVVPRMKSALKLKYIRFYDLLTKKN